MIEFASLSSTKPLPSPLIRFATFNVAQAKIDENVFETMFDNRWPLIKEMIKDSNVDILCLQELRNLETSSFKVCDVIYEIDKMGYDHSYTYYGSDKLSFALATFYRRDKFLLEQQMVQDFPLADEYKPHLRKIVMFTSMKCLATNKTFVVGNTHFGMTEHEKNESTKKLKDIFDSMTRNELPYICAGDFNFFDDMEGQQQRSLLLETSKDIAYPLSNASGTFMGFKQDQFKKSFDEMGRLDHIFINDRIMSINQAYAFGDMKLVQKREYPSDHLMIVANFCVK
jgi:endonuclease/exonuclease/phosphatase family metal-dependent hydrolase